MRRGSSRAQVRQRKMLCLQRLSHQKESRAQLHFTGKMMDDKSAKSSCKERKEVYPKTHPQSLNDMIQMVRIDFG